MKKINKYFIAQLAMFTKTNAVLTTFSLLWSSLTPMATVVTFIRALAGEIQSLEQSLVNGLKGITLTKNESRVHMVNTAMSVIRKIRTYAKATNNTTLFKDMSITRSYLLHCKEQVCMVTCKMVYDTADALPADTKTAYQMDAGIEQLQEGITAYISAKNTQDTFRLEMIANRAIMYGKMKTLMESLRNDLDNFVFTFSDEEFITQYKSARYIDKPAVQGSTLAAFVRDERTKAPLAGVQVLIQNDFTTIHTVTDAKGKFRQPISPELFDISFTIPGFQGYTGKVKVNAGGHEKMEVSLNPVPANS